MKEGEGLPPELVGAAVGHLHKSSMDITLSSGSLAMSERQQAETELIFTLGVVGRVLHMLSSHVFNEIKTLSPIEILEKNVQEVKTILPHICASFQHKITGFVRILEVRDFIRSLKRRAYEVEDILDKAATSHLEGKGIPERSADLNSGLMFIISDLEEIYRVTMGKMSGKPSYIPPVLLSDPTNSSSHYERLLSSWEDQIIDRESEKQQLLHWIFHPSNYQQHPNLILITGDSGIGKTSLAKLLYNDALVSTSFDLLLWASLKSTFSKDYQFQLKDVIAEIIRSFTPHSWFYLRGMNMETLKHTLCHILNCRKYLLVLDNIRYLNYVLWEELRKLFKVGSRGSAVIVTSSSTDSWDFGKVVEAKSFILKGLRKTSSHLLFTRSCNFDEEAELEYPFLSHIGQDIVHKCRGNPGAIKTLGSMLRTNRDEHMWKQVHESMFSVCLQSMSLELVQCFSVYSIISEHKALSRDELVYFWMAQGLLYSTEANDEDHRYVGHRYCNELLSRSFIQSYESDDHNRLFVNNAFKSLFTSITEEKIQHLGYPSRFADSSRHLICYTDIDIFRRDLNAETNARTFLFGRWPNAVRKGSLEGLISHLSHARVLLLDGSLFKELPESIGNLKLLRYLSLQWNHELQLLPNTICKLANLQTLDVSGCQQLTTLHKSMHTLPSFRHLFLSLKLTSIPGEVLKSLRSLHHLKICHSPNLYSIPEEIMHLTDLRILQIHDCPLLASLPNSIKFLKSLKELSIMNCEKLNLEKWDGLCGLRVLEFLQLQRLPMLINFPEGLLSAAHSLQHLILRDCQHLTTLPECLHKYKSLLEIAIKDCPSITSLPKEIKAIETLQMLKIVNCPHLTARCQTKKGEDWHLISHIPRISLQHQIIQNSGTSSTLKEHPGSRKDQDMVPKSSLVEEMIYSRSIFFLLVLQESDYEIEKDILIQLWMAEGCIDDELQGEEHFSFTLKHGCLIHSGTNLMTGEDTFRVNFRMITELRDTQKHISNTYLKWEHDEYQDSLQHTELIQHISFVCNDSIDGTDFQKLQQFKQLRTLIFLANHGDRVKRIPDQLFLSFENLRTLDMSRTEIRELPSSVGHMIQLRYFNISWTLIKRLPAVICTLTNLQTLKLKGCSKLQELPRQLNQLTNLRHLDADVLHQLETMPGRIGDLVSLRTLTAFIVGTEDGCKINELKGLNHLTGSFCIAMLECVSDASEAMEANLLEKKDLKTLELRWTASELSGKHINSHDVLKCLEPCTSLRELRILCYEGSSFPNWVGNPKFYELVHITFYKCDCILELPRVEQLPCLKHLGLVKMNSVAKIERRGDVAFPKLEKLEIVEMQNLESWDWRKRNERDFISLTELIINDCPELEKFDVLPHLSSIKHLEVRECPKLQSLSDEKLSDSLQVLIVEDCPKIQKKCLEKGSKEWDNIEHVPKKSIEGMNSSEDEDEDEYDFE